MSTDLVSQISELYIGTFRLFEFILVNAINLCISNNVRPKCRYLLILAMKKVNQTLFLWKN